jgi:hypothetical protein
LIRPLTIDDLPFALKIGRKFCELAGVSYNKDALTGSLLKLIDDGIVLRSDQGIIGGIVYPMYMSGELVAQEFFWYSEGGDGQDLLKAFESEAKKLGATKVIMMSLANEYQSKINEIYESNGYKHLESHFMKDM